MTVWIIASTSVITGLDPVIFKIVIPAKAGIQLLQRL
jgi:hypothetical protein